MTKKANDKKALKQKEQEARKELERQKREEKTKKEQLKKELEQEQPSVEFKMKQLQLPQDNEQNLLSQSIENEPGSPLTLVTSPSSLINSETTDLYESFDSNDEQEAAVVLNETVEISASSEGIEVEMKIKLVIEGETTGNVDNKQDKAEAGAVFLQHQVTEESDGAKTTFINETSVEMSSKPFAEMSFCVEQPKLQAHIMETPNKGLDDEADRNSRPVIIIGDDSNDDSSDEKSWSKLSFFYGGNEPASETLDDDKIHSEKTKAHLAIESVQSKQEANLLMPIISQTDQDVLKVVNEAEDHQKHLEEAQHAFEDENQLLLNASLADKIKSDQNFKKFLGMHNILTTPEPLNDFKDLVLSISGSPLKSSWTLYYAGKEKKDTFGQKNYEFWTNRIKYAATIKTIGEFWAVICHIKPPSLLETGSDYYLFRSHIKPEWEDPLNALGGKWDIEVDKKSRESTEMNELWENIMMLAIGEAFGDNNGSVNGVVIQVKQSKGHKIALWTNKLELEACLDIGRNIEKNVYPMLQKLHVRKLKYVLHSISKRRTGSETFFSHEVDVRRQ